VSKRPKIEEEKILLVRNKLVSMLSESWVAEILPENRERVAQLLGVQEDLIRDAHIIWASDRVKHTGRVREAIVPGRLTYTYHHMRVTREVFAYLKQYAEGLNTNVTTWITSLIHHYLQQYDWEPSLYKTWSVHGVKCSASLRDVPEDKRFLHKLYWPQSVLRTLTSRGRRLGMPRNVLIRSIICSVVNDDVLGRTGFGRPGTFPYVSSKQMFVDVAKYLALESRG
jgi:hypothetical protein